MRTASTARQLPVPGGSLATFSTCWLQTSTPAVTVHGELDAATCPEFIRYASALLPRCAHLILDLSAVQFFGTAGFSAVHTIGALADAQGVSWAMIPSREVTRLLRICDPDPVLPVHGNVTAALDCVQRGAAGFPRLVSAGD